jgi:hypothetical protein
LRDTVECEPMPETTVKGRQSPVQAYRIRVFDGMVPEEGSQ